MFEYDDRYDDIKYNEQKEYTEDEVPIEDPEEGNVNNG